MTVLCSCGKAALLVIVDLKGGSVNEGVPEPICIDCCYKVVSPAPIGRYRIAYLKGADNGTDKSVAS